MAHVEVAADFTRFVVEAQERLLQTAWLLTGSTSGAASLVQAALVETCVRWPGGAAPAHTCALRFLVTHDAGPGSASSPRDGAPTPAVVDHREETLSWLAGLSPTQRRVVVLRFFAGLSETETADLLATTPEEVSSAESGARTSLRDLSLDNRARLGGFARPTGGVLHPARPTFPPRDGSRSQAVPAADLRARLTTALPPVDLDGDAEDTGVDVRAALRRRDRAVWRRRLAVTVTAAAVVAAVAGGVTLLHRKQVDTATAGAAPTASATGTAAPMQATLHLDDSLMPQAGEQPTSGTDLGSQPHVVTLVRGPHGELTLDYLGASHTGGFGASATPLDTAAPRVTWLMVDRSHAIGVIPSATAQHTVDVITDHDYGGYTSDMQPIPGSDWTAFGISFSKPLTGEAPISDIRWYDHAGRPVGKDGRVGSSASVGGRTVWVTADHTAVGVLGVGSTSGRGPLPFFLTGARPDDPEPKADLTLFGPAQAVRATVTLSDRRTVAMAMTPLDARYSVARVSYPITQDDFTRPVRYVWTDAQGRGHPITLPS
ncbi:sigma factor-like helix-turn-helix DNA-binding protein [Dermatophilaceae bacterium Soc4.6]